MKVLNLLLNLFKQWNLSQSVPSSEPHLIKSCPKEVNLPIRELLSMKLEVLRISSQKDSTNGILFDVTGGQRKFLCYTLEDEYRPLKDKVMGETRIPAGTYKMTLRTVGGFHSRYLKKYGDDFHKGMLWVRGVPGFEYILIHTGNTDEHTAGCLLVGDTQTENTTSKPDGFVGSSVTAYKRIYPSIAKALKDGKSVTITYTDFDTI